MPQERLSMRKIRDVLRLSAGGLSKRKIATSDALDRPVAARKGPHGRSAAMD